MLVLAWKFRDVKAEVKYQGSRLGGQIIKKSKTKNDKVWSQNQKVLDYKA